MPRLLQTGITDKLKNEKIRMRSDKSDNDIDTRLLFRDALHTQLLNDPYKYIDTITEAEDKRTKIISWSVLSSKKDDRLFERAENLISKIRKKALIDFNYCLEMFSDLDTELQKLWDEDKFIVFEIFYSIATITCSQGLLINVLKNKKRQINVFNILHRNIKNVWGDIGLILQQDCMNFIYEAEESYHNEIDYNEYMATQFGLWTYLKLIDDADNMINKDTAFKYFYLIGNEIYKLSSRWMSCSEEEFEDVLC